MKVLITDNTHPALHDKLVDAGISCDIRPDCTYDSLLEIVNQYDAVVVRSKIIIDRHFIDHALHLKCIGRVGAGMETIDVDYAEQHGIRCLNSPEGNRDAVGEHATGLLLALMDRIALANTEVRHGLWRREANRGLEIKGRTVGIIGFGNMGAAFAQRLKGFECTILAYDKYRPAHCQTNFRNAQDYVQECSLEELQQRADIVSLHVPLTNDTHHLVSADFINAFAKPFYLINTSRGAVVDTPQLAAAMQRAETDNSNGGQILGAALDVIEYEDMSKDGLDLQTLPEDFLYLLHSDRTVLTPHVAGWTVESKYKLAAVLADKIIAHLQEADTDTKH